MKSPLTLSLIQRGMGILIGGNEMVLQKMVYGFMLLSLCATLALTSCDSAIDRDFGPSSLHGSGALPGRVITTSTATGL